MLFSVKKNTRNTVFTGIPADPPLQNLAKTLQNVAKTLHRVAKPLQKLAKTLHTLHNLRTETRSFKPTPT
jgi:hypothetical protein